MSPTWEELADVLNARQWAVVHHSSSQTWLLIFFFFLKLAIPAAYGRFQVRGQSGAAAATQATATVMWDLSHIFKLSSSFCQRQKLNPLSEARDEACISSWTLCWVLNPLCHNRNSLTLGFELHLCTLTLFPLRIIFSLGASLTPWEDFSFVGLSHQSIVNMQEWMNMHTG